MKYFISFYMWCVGLLGFLVVTLSGLIALQFYKPVKVFPWFHKWMEIVLRLMFVKIKVEYSVPLDLSKTYIFMPNHTSFLDVPVLGSQLPMFSNALEAASHFRWPIYGRLITKFEQIPIDRQNVRHSLESMNLAQERLKNGRSIVIFPEGTRSKTGMLLPFKKLPFFMAKKSVSEIVPVGLSGIYKLSPKGKFIIKPTIVTVRYGRPISRETMNTLKEEELMDLVKSEIINLVDDKIV